jgi:RNA-directed DNA polymerase
MNTASQPMYEWNTIPWSQAERAVFKLQKRIYQASSRGERITVREDCVDLGTILIGLPTRFE